jgi:hypothetical protein
MNSNYQEKYKTKLHKIRHKIDKLNQKIAKYDLCYQLTLEPISSVQIYEEINPKTGSRHKKWIYH